MNNFRAQQASSTIDRWAMCSPASSTTRQREPFYLGGIACVASSIITHPLGKYLCLYVYVYLSPHNVLIICIMYIIKTRSRCKCKRRKKSSWNLLVRQLYNKQDSCQSSKLINYAFCNHALGTIKARHDTSSLDTASCPCTTASQPHA